MGRRNLGRLKPMTRTLAALMMVGVALVATPAIGGHLTVDGCHAAIEDVRVGLDDIEVTSRNVQKVMDGLHKKLDGADSKLDEGKYEDALQKLDDFESKIVAMRDARKPKIEGEVAALLAALGNAQSCTQEMIDAHS